MADELKPAYLLAGGDRPKVGRALERLRRRFPPDAVELLDGTELSGEDAVAACNALGLFAGEGRLLVVENVDGWKAADAKAIGAYLKAPVPGTTLALVAGELKKDAPLAKAVAAAGDVLLWDVPKRGLQRWVAEQFGVHGAKADPEACRALVELVGEDLYDLAAEIDKLATWAGGARVGAEDVERLVAVRGEATSFALTDAWGARDVPGVLRASESMLERSGDPRSRTIPRLLGILGSHVARIRECQALEAGGVSAKDAAVRLRRNPYYVGKLYAQARNFSPEELREVTVRLADLDHALKGGSRLAPELELERALVEITRPAAARAEP
ncbi:MAG TPA: DNA polymerase III subunit delta [Gaiellaceae bacterium]|nr:DNA polymerase III subunit delta [Gaiellaceae bacterium]